MSKKIQDQIEGEKRKIARRLERAVEASGAKPRLAATNIHYEIAGKSRAIGQGGIAGDPSVGQ